MAKEENNAKSDKPKHLHANKLKQILDAEGLTQAKLVRETGMASTTINQICSQKNLSPSSATMSTITRAINTLIGKEKYTNSNIFIQIA